MIILGKPFEPKELIVDELEILSNKTIKKLIQERIYSNWIIAKVDLA